MIPDVEKILTTYLEGHADVAALLEDNRVVGRTPRNTDPAWVKITQLDAGDGGHPDHLTAVLVQLDCYASDDHSGAQAEANTLARTVRAALKEAHAETHAGAVISDVALAGHHRIPDADLEPARDRVTLTAVVSVHAA